MATSNNTKGPSRIEKNQEKERQLLSELKNLKQNIRFITDRLTLRTQAEVSGVIRQLNSENDLSPKKYGVILKALEAELDQLKIKPEQGRLKDLRRIEKFLNEVNQFLEENS